MFVELCRDGIVEEGEEVTILLFAGGDCGPHAFVIALSSFPTSALGDFSVDHAVANLLFAMVVGCLFRVR